MGAEPAELIGFLAPYPLGVQELALEARSFLLKMLAPVSELHYDATSAVCAGFAYGSKTADVFVNLAVYPKHVTLVFGWGSSLSDPEKRLRGEGKRVRHLRLASIETLQDPYVLDLISQASNAAIRKPDWQPERIIKIYNGPKRR